MNAQTTISINFPSDIYLALNKNESELQDDIKISLALRLYQQQKLTLGKAAQLAGLTRLEFENLLAENKIPISNLDFQDIENDIEKLK